MPGVHTHLALAALLLIATLALGAAGDLRHAVAQESRWAVAITLGSDGDHACALLNSGEIECWGANLAGQTDAPAGRFSLVSAGDSHTCGLRETGEIECWGGNWAGQADAPPERFNVVSAGRFHNCGLPDSGEVKCWGWNEHGQTDTPSGRFNAVSAGRLHSCGVRETGEIECWGNNEWGQTDAPAGRFSAVGAGGWHSCGLRETGAIECWGYTFDGQAQPPAGKYRSVSAGNYHTCAVRVDGAVTCWMIYNGAADVSAWLRQPADFSSGQIVARRLAGGRLEAAWLPAASGELILPQQRYFPANAELNRWLRSDPIAVNGVEIGRINARLRADGRVEFAFTPTGGDRILPPLRFFPADTRADHWLYSTEIELSE